MSKDIGDKILRRCNKTCFSSRGCFHDFFYAGYVKWKVAVNGKNYVDTFLNCKILNWVDINTLQKQSGVWDYCVHVFTSEAVTAVILTMMLKGRQKKMKWIWFFLIRVDNQWETTVK